MVPLKLVRSLVLGKTINDPHILSQNRHHDHNRVPSQEAETDCRSKTGSATFSRERTSFFNSYHDTSEACDGNESNRDCR
ncbi:hypothetical protein L6164_014992 [Bauhinia variegata]|uniref:Uncharacterized protein n=1 Tax=Bauhinia variegata TaxID=167791 RepID=A0ACB9NP02_BAUVA|nr:hypothetical protein L6164_014992 [Bauhinia variegata]